MKKGGSYEYNYSPLIFGFVRDGSYVRSNKVYTSTLASVYWDEKKKDYVEK